MSLKRFAIEEWVGSLVLSSIPISGRDKLFKYLLVSNSVLLAAFSKIVLYEYCQTLLTFTCLIPPHSLDGKFSLSRPRLVAGPDRAGWLQDAPEFISTESEQPGLVLPLVLLPHNSIQLINLTLPSLLLLHYMLSLNLFTEPGLPGSRLNFSFLSRPALALTPRNDIDCIIDQVSRRLSSHAD